MAKLVSKKGTPKIMKGMKIEITVAPLESPISDNAPRRNPRNNEPQSPIKVLAG